MATHSVLCPPVCECKCKCNAEHARVSSRSCMPTRLGDRIYFVKYGPRKRPRKIHTQEDTQEDTVPSARDSGRGTVAALAPIQWRVRGSTVKLSLERFAHFVRNGLAAVAVAVADAGVSGSGSSSSSGPSQGARLGTYKTGVPIKVEGQWLVAR